MTTKEAIIRLEMDKHIMWLWNDFQSLYEHGALSAIEIDIWFAITKHPAIQSKIDEKTKGN